MRLDRTIHTLFALALGISCTAAFGGPPFLTDDPEPVALAHAEINLIGQQTRAAIGRTGAFSAEMNIGCADETQCHVALPVAFDHPAGGAMQTGFGDAEVGVKYRFLDRPDDGWSAAVYPTVDLPTGGRLGNGRLQLLLPLWVQRSVGHWVVDAGIARLVDRAPAARDSWFTGLLVQRSFGDWLSLGTELFRRTATTNGEPSASGMNIGAIVNVAPRQNVLVSAGRGLTQVETNRCSTFLAYQLEL